jgi:hypothetical protein
MSCCGQKRRAVLSTRAATVSPPTVVLQNPVLLTQAGSAAVVVRGPASGQSYLFAPAGSALTVDERDVPALLETGRFHLFNAALADRS